MNSPIEIVTSCQSPALITPLPLPVSTVCPAHTQSKDASPRQVVIVPYPSSFVHVVAVISNAI
jgi:hypothetical protein